MSSRRATTEQAPTFAVRNPGTGEHLDDVRLMDAADVAAAVSVAREAQSRWGGLTIAERADVIDAFRLRLVSHRGPMVEVLTAETGKTNEDAVADLMIVVTWAKWWARHAAGLLADQKVTSLAPFGVGRSNVIRYEPLGVVGVVGPWNVPLSLTVGDALPALMAGNSVVIKPSEVTPLSALLAERYWVEAGGPPGVLTVVTGDGTTGTALVDEVDCVMFTGSVATGRKVAAQAGANLTPFSLELGGNDPMIVLDDADLERAANAAAYYGLFNAGQICMSTERIYVEAGVHDRFVDRLVEIVGSLRQGPPGPAGSVDLGAVINPPQAEIVARHVKDAVDKGARVLTGGAVSTDGGEYFAPTVMVDVDHSMECMREETFGPTLPVMRVADVHEAVRLANDSQYGLTASVWTRDLRRGAEVARQLQAGTVTVNDSMSHLALPELPMGGWKSSGVGARNGPDGIRKYCRRQVIQVNRIARSHEPIWFPYRAGVARVLTTATKALYGRPSRGLRSLGPAQAVSGIRRRLRS